MGANTDCGSPLHDSTTGAVDRVAYTRCLALFDKWAKEGYKMCASEAHAHGMKFGEVVSQEYMDNVQKVARRQIVLGGYRLADLLKVAVSKIRKNLLEPADHW